MAAIQMMPVQTSLRAFALKQHYLGLSKDYSYKIKNLHIVFSVCKKWTLKQMLIIRRKTSMSSFGHFQIFVYLEICKWRKARVSYLSFLPFCLVRLSPVR